MLLTEKKERPREESTAVKEGFHEDGAEKHRAFASVGVLMRRTRSTVAAME